MAQIEAHTMNRIRRLTKRRAAMVVLFPRTCGDGGANLPLGLIAKNPQPDDAARSASLDQFLQPLEAGDVLAVESSHYVTRFQPGLVRGRAGKHQRDSRPVRIVLPAESDHALRFAVGLRR